MIVSSRSNVAARSDVGYRGRCPDWMLRQIGSFVELLPQPGGTPMTPQPADVVLSTDASDGAAGRLGATLVRRKLLALPPRVGRRRERTADRAERESLFIDWVGHVDWAASLRRTSTARRVWGLRVRKWMHVVPTPLNPRSGF